MHTSLEATAPLLRGGWKSGEQGVVRFVWQRWFDYQQKLYQKRSFFSFTRAINVFKQEYKLNENINLFKKKRIWKSSVKLHLTGPQHSRRAEKTFATLDKTSKLPSLAKTFQKSKSVLTSCHAYTHKRITAAVAVSAVAGEEAWVWDGEQRVIIHMDSSAQRGLLYIPYGLVHLPAAHSFNSHSFDNLLTVEPVLGGHPRGMTWWPLTTG